MPSNRPEYRRAWVAANREKAREYVRRHYALYGSKYDRDPEKVRARSALNQAVRSGKIDRPETCQVCGLAPGRDHRGRSLVQAHHPDHADPLRVVWADPLCHASLEAA